MNNIIPTNHNPIKLFTPSSTLLLTMIASAEAKLDAAREQSRLRAEARGDARAERAMVAETKARYYASILHGSR